MAKNYFDNFAGLYNIFMKLFGKAGATAKIIEKQSNINSNSKVLDVGGGTGLIANHLSAKVREIFVLDPSKNMLSKIKNPKTSRFVSKASNLDGFKTKGFDSAREFHSRHAQELNSSRKVLDIGKIQGSAEKIPFKKEKFDLVYCVDSFHHFTNGQPQKKWQNIIHKCISELLRVLKKGGVLLIIDFDTSKFEGKIIKIFENNIMKWQSYFLNPLELKELFKKYNVKYNYKYINNYIYVVKIVNKV